MDSEWNLTSLKEDAPTWNLAGDSKLLEIMEKMSKNLETRCNTTKTNINKMLLELDKTNIRVENATNKILCLKNVQFMEARVKDEVEMNTSSKKVDLSQDATKENGTMLEAIQFAVGNGLKMLDNCYEKVVLDIDDDSDDEENVPKSVLFRAKNPYNNDPMPYLIGSKLWNEKWHIGLLDSDDDDISKEDDGDDFSTSSEDPASLAMSLSSTANTLSEFDRQSHVSDSDPQKPIPGYPQPLFEPVSDLFSDLQPEIFIPPVITFSVEPVVATASVASEVKQNQESKNTIFRTNTTVQPSNFFDNEPPEIDIPVPSNRKPVNLFVDSDEDDDMFATVTTKKADTQTKQQLSKAKNIDDQILHGPVAAPRSKSTIDEAPVKKTQNLVQVLPKEPLKKSNILNLFDDTPPDDLFDVLIAKGAAKSGNKNKGLFDDFDDFESGDAISATQADLSKINAPFQSDQNKLKSGMFDDDFDIPDQITPKLTDAQSSKANLFDNFDDTPKINKEKLSKATEKNELFDELSDDNDLFAPKKSTVKSSNSSELFNNNDDDDLFGRSTRDSSQSNLSAKSSKSSLSTPSKVKTVDKLGQINATRANDSNIVKKQAVPKNAITDTTNTLLKSKSLESKKQNTSLFKDLSDDDDDSLFGNRIGVTKSVKQQVDSVKPIKIDSNANVNEKVKQIGQVKNNDQPETTGNSNVNLKSAPVALSSDVGAVNFERTHLSPEKSSTLRYDLFDDSEKFERTSTVDSSSKAPLIIKKTVGLFDDLTDDEDLIEKRSIMISNEKSDINDPDGESSSAANKKSTTTFVKTPPEPSKTVLFDDFSDDDLFGGVNVSKFSKSSKNTSIFDDDIFASDKKSLKVPSKTNTLFDNLDDLFVEKSTKGNERNLFAKSENEVTAKSIIEPDIDEEVGKIKLSSENSQVNQSKTHDELARDNKNTSEQQEASYTATDEMQSNNKPEIIEDSSIKSGESTTSTDPGTSKNALVSDDVVNEQSNDLDKSNLVKDDDIIKIGSIADTEAESSRINQTIENVQAANDKYARSDVAIPRHEATTNIQTTPIDEHHESDNTIPKDSSCFDKVNEATLFAETLETPKNNQKENRVINEPSKEIFVDEPESSEDQQHDKAFASFPVKDSSIKVPDLDSSRHDQNTAQIITEINDDGFNFDNTVSNYRPVLSKRDMAEPQNNSPTVFWDEEPPPFDPLDTPATVKKAIVSVGPVGLFDDLPPDDDLFESSSTTTSTGTKSTTSNIFYDDFAETIVAKPTPVKSDSFNMFSDEPPPDDNHETLPTRTTDEIDKSINLHKDEFREKLNLFSNPIASPVETSAATRNKPNKLNENFKINVAALLPGAKRPSFKSPVLKEDATEQSSSVERTGTTEQSTVEPTQKKQFSAEHSNQTHLREATKSSETQILSGSKSEDISVEGHSRLTSLSKNRVKIQVQRRPSTRRGRQAEYRKSLLANQQEAEVISSIETQGSSIKDMFSKINVKKEDNKLLPKIDRKNKAIENLPISSTINIAPTVDDNSDDDWLAKASASFKKTTIKQKTKEPIKMLKPSVFSDDDDDDLFAASSGLVKNTSAASNKTTLPFKTNLEVPSKSISLKLPPAKSLFDDENNDDDDDIFTSKPPTVEKKNKAQSLIKTIQSKGGLFSDDSDEDDNDIFSSKKTSFNKSRTAITTTKQNKQSSATSKTDVTGDPLSDLLR